MLARYEFKYLLTEAQAESVRAFATAWLEPDDVGGGRYDVYSVYLDTWDWQLANWTIGGFADRFKLRARTYDFRDPNVFLEIKERVGSSILKYRALVDRSQAEAICRGEMPPRDGYRAQRANEQPALDRFRNLLDRLDLRPRLWVGYDREAWVSPFGDGSRLTFDEFIEVQPSGEALFAPDPGAWTAVRPAQVLDEAMGNTKLELKFNGASPGWMRRLVHDHGLRRISFSKYVHGLTALGEVPWTRQEWGSAWMT